MYSRCQSTNGRGLLRVRSWLRSAGCLACHALSQDMPYFTMHSFILKVAQERLFEGPNEV